ncbi:MAG TPA: zf-HC2 domain-containing protein [Candidatus Binataceae bacterium]|nr:zf-HC2 domain-containing protein [Candidatus Binataceae bacterium]
MDCGTYIADYLTPHADGELRGAELARAEAHVAKCPQCAAALAEERELKAMLHVRAGMLRTPPQVRGSILAALDAADRRETTPRRAPAPSRRPAIVRGLRYAIPIALAAAIAFFVIILRNPTPAESYPAFDYATDHYDQFLGRFDPNVPSDSPGDIAAAYIDHKMPGYLWNFQPSGYKLLGGRIEKMPDGRFVTNTFYRSDDGAILCSFVASSGLKLPPRDADELGVHHFFEYRGHTICMSYLPGGKYVCILVSRKPMKAFMQDIAASEL